MGFYLKCILVLSSNSLLSTNKEPILKFLGAGAPKPRNSVIPTKNCQRLESNTLIDEGYLSSVYIPST
jgi:hypothetical protein